MKFSNLRFIIIPFLKLVECSTIILYHALVGMSTTLYKILTATITENGTYAKNAKVQTKDDATAMVSPSLSKLISL